MLPSRRRDEFDAAERTLVIEQDAGRGMQAEALAIVHGHPMTIELGHGVGRARIERGFFVLQGLLDEPVHFGGGRLIKARIGRAEAHRFKHVGYADGGDIGGQQRLAPRGSDKGLRGEIIDFVRLNFPHDAQQAGDIRYIAIVRQNHFSDAQPAQAMILDPAMRRTADHAVNRIALVQQ